MSTHDRGTGGGFVRDGATQTGRAVVLIVVAVVVAVVLLHHNAPPKAVTASTTSSGLTGHKGGGTTPTSTPGAKAGGTTSTTAPRSTSSTTPPSTVPAGQVKVLVLNGTEFSQPYASQFTTKVHDDGYATLTPNNASSVVKASAIYVITTGYAPEAKGLASALGLPASAVATTVPTGPPLNSSIATTGANLVLVVGPDLATKKS